jgi:hypothetical protein
MPFSAKTSETIRKYAKSPTRVKPDWKLNIRIEKIMMR